MNFKRAQIYFIIVASLGLAAGCQDGAKGKGTANGAHSGRPGGAPPGHGQSQGKPVAVAVTRVEVGRAAAFYTTTATLEAKARAEIRSRSTGIVRHLLVEEGDRVERGQTVLRLEDQDQTLALRQAKLEKEKVESEFDRRERMSTAGILASEELELSENALQKAQAQVEAAELALSRTRVQAPFRGRIVNRMVDQGEHVDSGTTLFAIMDVEPLLVRVHVPAPRLGSVRVGQDISVQVDNGEPLTATLSLISPIVDPDTGTVKITAELSGYPDGIRPGDFAKVRVATESRGGAKLVPSQAVFDDQGKSILYVADGAIADRREVVVGFMDGGKTEIISGVEPEELVVIKGQQNLRPGATLAIREAPDGVEIPKLDAVDSAGEEHKRGPGKKGEGKGRGRKRP